MFDIAVGDVAALGKAVSVISDLVDDANFTLTSEGLSMEAMDSSHVCLVVLDVKQAYFESFAVQTPDVFGIKLGVLKRVLECSSGKTTLSREDEDSIVVQSDRARFSVKLIDIDSESVNPAFGEQDATVVVDSTAFQRLVKDLVTFGDVVELKASEDGFDMTTRGDIGEACMRVATKRADVRASARGEFAIRYLVSFAKAAAIASEVTLGFSNFGVLALDYAFGEHARLSFYIAPKIEDDGGEEYD